MFRKTLIAVAAAATLALGVGATASTAEAGVKIYLGTPYVSHFNGYYQDAGYYTTVCKWKRVWYHGYWKKVKVCRKVYHDGYQSY